MLKIFRWISHLILDFVETIVVGLAFFVIIYLFLFQPHQVKGSSMYPAFQDGEYLLTDKISYRFRAPARGDVIIFKAPLNEEYDYIKRVIGLPGETVRVQDGKVYINNVLLTEDYLPPDYVTNGGTYLPNGKSIVLLPNEYFALGDNRSHSSDSREWGVVPKANIVGKAFLRYWPTARFGLIKLPTY